MATKVYFRAPTSATTIKFLGHTGEALKDQDNNYLTRLGALSTSPGTALSTWTTNTVAGPISGTALTGRSGSGSGAGALYVSPPLDRAVTISGTMTYNIWASESSMNANATIKVMFIKISGTNGTSSQVLNANFSTELSTTLAACNWTATPSSTSFAKGDRIGLYIMEWDATATTMASGFTITHTIDGPTGGSSGDSWVQFTETFDFQQTTVSGTTFYPNNISVPGLTPPGGTDYWLLALTDANSGGANATAVTGPASPITMKASLTTNPFEMYTNPLQAFTLSGVVNVALPCTMQLGATNNDTFSMRAALDVVNNDGSLSSAWGAINNDNSSDPTNCKAAIHFISTTWGTINCWLSGADVAVSDGQRLRVKLYFDDAMTPMVTGWNPNMSTHGSSPFGFVQLSQSV